MTLIHQNDRAVQSIDLCHAVLPAYTSEALVPNSGISTFRTKFTSFYWY